MRRRAFISLVPFSSLPVFIGCSASGNRTHEGELELIQNKIFEYYNQGNIGAITQLLDSDFSFIDGGVSGSVHDFEKRLGVLHRHHKTKGELPLSIGERKATVVSNVGWIICSVNAHLQKHKYGFLTQILKQHNSGWSVVHQHFSLSLDPLTNRSIRAHNIPTTLWNA